MFNFFKKKSPKKKVENSFAGRKFGPFVIRIPQEWDCLNDNGTLRVTNNEDTVRLNITIRDFSNIEYSLDEFFETLKTGWFSSDYNWSTYSDITQKDDLIYQTLEYLDDPRLILAVIRKQVGNKEFVLNMSFAGNTRKDIDTHLDKFHNVLFKIDTLNHLNSKE
ncbi:hypothetical protein [Aquimarina algicola]|uniref:Uncharacterized protein n=1 Tax=Aquimarina algicola TaxID=2589995 RepID=A0A504JH27_9FLAO|nr:hypothetical protein [Aquimarina algicola]TPN86983.1 hypothetical protein FHK87_05155 [Aquimarina algicola]